MTMTGTDDDQERDEINRRFFESLPFPMEGQMQFRFGEVPETVEERQRYNATFFAVTAWELTGVRRCATCGSPSEAAGPPSIPCSRRCRDVLDQAVEAQHEYERAIQWDAVLRLGSGSGDMFFCERERHSWLCCRAVRLLYRIKAALCLMFVPVLMYESGGSAPVGGKVLVQWVKHEAGELYTLRVGRGWLRGWFAWVTVRNLDETPERLW